MDLDSALKFFARLQEAYLLNFGANTIDPILAEMDIQHEDAFAKGFLKLCEKTADEIKAKRASLIVLDREALLKKYNPLPPYLFNDPLKVARTHPRSADIIHIDARKISCQSICVSANEKPSVSKRHYKTMADGKTLYADITLAFHFLDHPESVPAFMKEKVGVNIPFFFFEGTVMEKEHEPYKYYTVGLWWNGKEFMLRERDFESAFWADCYTVIIKP